MGSLFKTGAYSTENKLRALKKYQLKQRAQPGASASFALLFNLLIHSLISFSSFLSFLSLRSVGALGEIAYNYF